MNAGRDVRYVPLAAERVPEVGRVRVARAAGPPLGALVNASLVRVPLIPFAWDTETALIAQGLQAPPLTCVTWAAGSEAGILHHREGVAMMRDALQRPDILFIGQNVAYDFAVLAAEAPDLFPLIWRAYCENRVTCTKIRQQLLDIAAGKFRGGPDADGTWRKWGYSLDDMARRFLGTKLAKGTKNAQTGETGQDSWRLQYAHFRDVPLERWVEHAQIIRPDLDPHEVITYPVQDGVSTLLIWRCQEDQNTGPGAPPGGWLQDQFRQVRGQFWLHLMSARGIRTNLGKIEFLEHATREARNALASELASAGLLKWNKSKGDWSRDTKNAAAAMVAACRANGLPIRRTKTGELKRKNDPTIVFDDSEYVCLDEDACKASEDPTMQDYAEFTTLTKVLSNDVKMLFEGSYYPIHSRFDIVWTGRTSSSKPNVQNVRRLPGIRECFEPREGYVFLECDYPSIELYTLAETCALRVGSSELGRVLREGRDPHTEFAGRILQVSDADAYAMKKLPKESADYKRFDYARQTAKVANFGLPGGLGIKTFVHFARKQYKVKLTEGEARALKEMWFEQWPEMRPYFDWVKSLFWQTGVEKDTCSVEQLHVGRYRGGCTFCNGCNTSFQGLASDIAKAAGWRITGECFGTEGDYDGRPSPLAGGRIVNFVHDQFFLEYPEIDPTSMHNAAMRLGKIMQIEANKFLTTVPILDTKMEPTIIRYWSKDASQVWENGQLRVWPPRNAIVTASSSSVTAAIPAAST